MDIEHKVYHWPNGNTHRELWFSNNVLHRIDGPAEICYNESGIIGEEYWLITGKYNREDGPAIILYSKTGRIEQEYWFSINKLHRIDGPAAIKYFYFDDNKEEFWYLNDRQLSNKESIEYKEWLIDNNIYKPYNTWTDDEKILWKLTWT